MILLMETHMDMETTNPKLFERMMSGNATLSEVMEYIFNKVDIQTFKRLIKKPIIARLSQISLEHLPHMNPDDIMNALEDYNVDDWVVESIGSILWRNKDLFYPLSSPNEPLLRGQFINLVARVISDETDTHNEHVQSDRIILKDIPNRIREERLKSDRPWDVVYIDMSFNKLKGRDANDIIEVIDAVCEATKVSELVVDLRMNKLEGMLARNLVISLASLDDITVVAFDQTLSQDIELFCLLRDSHLLHKIYVGWSDLSEKNIVSRPHLQDIYNEVKKLSDEEKAALKLAQCKFLNIQHDAVTCEDIAKRELENLLSYKCS